LYTSIFGCLLDPIAYKLLVWGVFLLLANKGTMDKFSLWAAIIILCREILVSGLREYLAGLKVSVPVTRLAKWKTTVQMVSLGFLIAGPAGDKVLPQATHIGIVLLWISAIITLYTGYDYFRAGLKHVIDE
jgi:cardiolipin synthase